MARWLTESSGPEEGQIARAKDLALDLLEVVRAEWQKAKNVLDQQMGVNQYAAYYAVSISPILTAILG